MSSLGPISKEGYAGTGEGTKEVCENDPRDDVGWVFDGLNSLILLLWRMNITVLSTFIPPDSGLIVDHAKIWHIWLVKVQKLLFWRITQNHWMISIKPTPAIITQTSKESNGRITKMRVDSKLPPAQICNMIDLQFDSAVKYLMVCHCNSWYNPNIFHNNKEMKLLSCSWQRR